MEYLYIMDYSDCTISRINITDIEYDDIDRILKEKGFNVDECAYMYSDKEINNIDIID